MTHIPNHCATIEFVHDNGSGTFEIPQVILDAAAAKREFYYLLSSGQVVEGPQGSWRDRIGPYPTREAAAKALLTARQRDAAWEEQSKTYRA